MRKLTFFCSFVFLLGLEADGLLHHRPLLPSPSSRGTGGVGAAAARRRVGAMKGAAASVGVAISPPPLKDAAEVARGLWVTKDLFKTEEHALIRCGEGEPRFRLAYMPIRNRGEIIRLILEEAKVPYEVEVMGFENWKNGLKATTPHGKCPVLRNYDGRGNDLGQEGAITRFLAEECGLAGETSAERANLDSLYCLWFSTFRNLGVSHDGEHFSVAALRDGDPSGRLQSAGDATRYQDMFRQNDLSRIERSLSALRFFEETLSTAGTGFLVREAPTYVDLGLFYTLFELAEDDNVPDFAARYDLPLLGAFLRQMQERPHILDYLKSPRRMPRYQREASGASTYMFWPGKYSPDLSL
uniref:GST C-terminal domain-containing protein n=1 Tax=Hemiselmis andersenii TaxID=464988 RepID=A0A7S1MWL7_HEMAN|mmetsp:Transcript_61060/g.146908  ORF Transcript_61060/g.146908 Transcript_61060/m.146908 type:complete len:356 (+) Transcript_61060:99-1166(+)